MPSTKISNPEPKNKWPIIIFIIIALFLVSAFFALIVSIFTGGNEQYSDGNTLIIPIEGEITSGSSSNILSSTVSSDNIINSINQAESDDSIKAVIFEINSPGGAPVGSHEIVKAIKSMKKPKVSVIRDVGASGAYWVASSTERIFADEMSVTGSVGVLASYLNFYKFLDRYNITYQRIVGGEYKDISSPFTELTDQERLELDQKVSLLDTFFLDDVTKNRNLTREQRSVISTGIFYIGIEAKDLNLIDEFGGEKEALAYLKEKTGVEMTPKRIIARKGILDLIGSLSYTSGANFANGFKDSMSTQQKISLN